MADPGLWPLRALWLVQPVAAGPALAHLAAGRSTAVGLVLAVLLWAGWAIGLVATLVPHPLGLSGLRVAGPAALGATVIAALRPGIGPVAAVAGIAAALLACLAIAAPFAVDALVDGGSYGPERRMALRIPASLLAGPLPLAVGLAAAGAATGPLLVAARQWLVGGLALAVGWPLAVAAFRRLHGLALRCVVFVPAGFVLHDRSLLSEPVLFPRARVATLAAAQVGTAATDLTAGALGLVVEARLTGPVDAGLRRGRQDAVATALDAFLFAPVRPGALLAEAASRNIAVG